MTLLREQDRKKNRFKGFLFFFLPTVWKKTKQNDNCAFAKLYRSDEDNLSRCSWTVSPSRCAQSPSLSLSFPPCFRRAQSESQCSCILADISDNKKSCVGRLKKLCLLTSGRQGGRGSVRNHRHTWHVTSLSSDFWWIMLHCRRTIVPAVKI